MGFLLPMAATAVGASAETASTLATIGSVISGIGTVASTIGSIEQGDARAAAASANARIQKQNAQLVALEGEQKAAMEEQKTRAKVGGIVANQAAAGIDVNTGSAVDVRSSASELGELNAINIRSNAAREAYNYQTQAALDTSEAKNDRTAGLIGGATTFLGGMGQNINQYEGFMMNQGLDTSGLSSTGTYEETLNGQAAQVTPSTGTTVYE